MRQRHAEIINSKPPGVEPPLQLVQSTGQWGAFAPEADGHDRGGIHFIDRRGQSWNGMEIPARPDAVGMRRVGKGRAGRMLDGRTWDEFPGRRLVAATHS